MKNDANPIYLVPIIPNLSILDEWLPIIRHLQKLQPAARVFGVLDIEWKSRQALDPKFDLVVLSKLFFAGCIVRRASGKTLLYDSVGQAGRAEHLLEARIWAPPGLRVISRALAYFVFRILGSLRTMGRPSFDASSTVYVLADPAIFSIPVVLEFLGELGASQYFLLPHGAGWK